MAESPLTPEEFQTLTNVSRETLEKLRLYEALLRKWTPKINLVSAESLTDLWRRHFLDSWQMVPLLAAKPRGVLVDFGSGGGFPGLFLALGTPHKVHLIESDARKTVFLQEVARQLGLEAVVLNQRIEAVKSFPADFITARAFAALDKICDLAGPFLHGQSEIWLLKSQNVEGELTNATKSWHFQYQVIPSQTSHTGVVIQLREIRNANQESH